MPQALYLVLSALLARAIQRQSFPDMRRAHQTPAYWLAWITLFFAVFFGGYYALGCLELATGLAVVTAPNALLVVLAGLVALALKRRKSPPRVSLTEGWTGGMQGILDRWRQISGIAQVATLAVMAAFVLIAGMLMAEYPNGYDPTAYHLPIGVHMLQSGSLGLWDSAFIHALPANSSIFFGFLLAFLPEGVVSFASLLFLAPLALAVYALSRLTGAGRTSCLLSTLGLLTTPIVALNAVQARSDVAGIVFLAAAVYFALDTEIEFQQRCVLSGLAAGIAFGFKSPHLVSLPFLFVILAWSHGKPERPDQENSFPRQGAMAGLLWFAFAFAAMAGFWLARNYLQLGNPLYPAYLARIFDFLGWPAPPDVDTAHRSFSQHLWVRSSLEWLIYPWTEPHTKNAGFRHDSGFGPFVALTIPPVIFGVGMALLTKRGAHRTILAWLLGGAVFSVAPWWILGDRQPRFLMHALIYLPPLAAWTLTQTRRLRRMYEAAIALTIAFMLAVLVSMQVAEFGWFAARAGGSQGLERHLFYLYPEAIDRLPAGSTIVNLAGRPWSYPLAGRDLRNRVVSFLEASRQFNIGRKASRNPVDDWFQYPNLTPDYRLTDRQLHALRATHVFTAGVARLKLDGCVELMELDRVDRTPAESHARLPPRVLYEIHYCTQ